MKVEFQLAFLDEWMIRWKHFQTLSDYQIEESRAKSRRFAYAGSSVWLFSSYVWTAGNATVRRWTGHQNFFDIGFDGAAKASVRKVLLAQKRYTPTGWGRVLFMLAPPLLFSATVEHNAEVRRWNAYLKQETVFGEQARRFEKTGVIEEFLCANIKASLPPAEAKLFG